MATSSIETQEQDADNEGVKGELRAAITTSWINGSGPRESSGPIDPAIGAESNGDTAELEGTDSVQPAAAPTRPSWGRKSTNESSGLDTQPQAVETDTKALFSPKGLGFRTLESLRGTQDPYCAVGWGPEGSGKSLWFLKNFPYPVLVNNLDRPMTTAHLGLIEDDTRVANIFFENLRPDMKDISLNEAMLMVERIEANIHDNIKDLARFGGTVMIDGGTLLGDLLKAADPTIAEKQAANKRWNPKDKQSINAYLAALVAFVMDHGVHFCITGHSANSWEMKSIMGDDGQAKNQLTRTNNLYAKMDKIFFERANLSLLMFKRCVCGRNITKEDGTCDAAGVDNPMEDRPAKRDEHGILGHQGRRHMVRVVANKFNTAVESTEWEDLDWAQLKLLSDPKRYTLLL